MERDFWSIDNAPLDCKKDLECIFRLIKFGYAILLLNLFGVVALQYVLDIYAKWPFISTEMYPYYVAASIFYTFGSYFATYTYFLIYCYACFHIYCQMVLMNEYFKQLKSNCFNDGKIKISATGHISLAIQQHKKLIGWVFCCIQDSGWTIKVISVWL